MLCPLFSISFLLYTPNGAELSLFFRDLSSFIVCQCQNRWPLFVLLYSNLFLLYFTLTILRIFPFNEAFENSSFEAELFHGTRNCACLWLIFWTHLHPPLCTPSKQFLYKLWQWPIFMCNNIETCLFQQKTRIPPLQRHLLDHFAHVGLRFFLLMFALPFTVSALFFMARKMNAEESWWTVAHCIDPSSLCPAKKVSLLFIPCLLLTPLPYAKHSWKSRCTLGFKFLIVRFFFNYYFLSLKRSTALI